LHDNARKKEKAQASAAKRQGPEMAAAARSAILHPWNHAGREAMLPPAGRRDAECGGAIAVSRLEPALPYRSPASRILADLPPAWMLARRLPWGNRKGTGRTGAEQTMRKPSFA
jgi:hypothetical protein